MGRGNPQIESPESASPVVTRAVAASLQGRYHTTYHLQSWERAALRILGLFPQSVGQAILPRFVALNALDPSTLKEFTLDRLLIERLTDYADLLESFPAITIGAALGGASAHLALALGGPFLPQAFVMTLKGGSPSGDISVYLQRSLEQAKAITEANPGIISIQHFDPIHDGWLTGRTNQLRLKLTSLPEPYKQFILQRLTYGGAVCYLDCGAEWLRFQLGNRNYIQVGGWGGIPAEEFIRGSSRIDEYCHRQGFVQCGWCLDDYPLEPGPESEWGSEPGLAEELEDFCKEKGIQFLRIRMPEPHDFSRLAYLSFEALISQAGDEPAGVLIEMFSQFDASTVMKTGLLPVWLVYNTPDSLAFLIKMRSRFPSGKPVFFAPLSTFSITPDLVPWEEWVTALAGLDWRNIGTRPSHYPADTRTISDWATPLRNWAEAHSHHVRSRLSIENLLSLSLLE
jgi:hypothetical protein